MPNARHSPRQRRRFKVTLGRTCSFTIDVCAGGFSTELMRVLPPGTALTGSIRVGDKDFAFAGQVAWANPGSSNLNLRGRMGVRFTKFAGDFSQLVRLPEK
jgi:hypothetical protein